MATTTLPKLTARPVETDADIETLRVIRNSGVSDLSRNAIEVTPEQQRAYWERNREYLQVWLYSAKRGKVVGYGSLRRDGDDGDTWASVGVLPEHRGSGYGTAILRDVVRRTDGPVYAETLKTNIASLKAHDATGDWQLVVERPLAIVQVTSKEIRGE